MKTMARPEAARQRAEEMKRTIAPDAGDTVDLRDPEDVRRS
jgi:hypothetical protein